MIITAPRSASTAVTRDVRGTFSGVVVIVALGSVAFA
jgi:hypothetical protein